MGPRSAVVVGQPSPRSGGGRHGGHDKRLLDGRLVDDGVVELQRDRCRDTNFLAVGDVEGGAGGRLRGNRRKAPLDWHGFTVGPGCRARPRIRGAVAECLTDGERCLVRRQLSCNGFTGRIAEADVGQRSLGHRHRDGGDRADIFGAGRRRRHHGRHRCWLGGRRAALSVLATDRAADDGHHHSEQYSYQRNKTRTTSPTTQLMHFNRLPAGSVRNQMVQPTVTGSGSRWTPNAASTPSRTVRASETTSALVADPLLVNAKVCFVDSLAGASSPG